MDLRRARSKFFGRGFGGRFGGESPFRTIKRLLPNGWAVAAGNTSDGGQTFESITGNGPALINGGNAGNTTGDMVHLSYKENGAHVWFPGDFTNYVSIPAPSIIDDFIILIDSLLISESNVQWIIGQYNTTSSRRSFGVSISINNEILVWGSDDGLVNINPAKSTNLPLGTKIEHLRVTRNGSAVLFERKLEGVWVDITSDGSWGISGSLYNNTIDAYMVSKNTSENNEPFKGNIGKIKMIDASNGNSLEFDPSKFGDALTYIDPVSGELVTCNQSAGTGDKTQPVTKETGDRLSGNGVSQYATAAPNAVFDVADGAEKTFVFVGELGSTYASGGGHLLSWDSITNGGSIRPTNTAAQVAAHLRGSSGVTLTEAGSPEIRGSIEIISVVYKATTVELWRGGAMVDSDTRTDSGFSGNGLTVLAQYSPLGNYQIGMCSGVACANTALTGEEQLDLLAAFNKINGRTVS